MLLLDHVRIHLDRVEGLGDFVEFEAVMGDGDTPATEEAKLRRLMADLGISDNDLESRAYADLLRD